MAKRHDTIGIKQVVRLEWMQKAAELQASGMMPKQVRQELHDVLAESKGSGAEGQRGDTSRSQVVNMLVNIWVTPDKGLSEFRDALLDAMAADRDFELAAHWAMISAAYPFWLNSAKHVGRLLGLQDRVTQAQITKRVKEQYGDRQTVSRYTRYTIRSYVAWGVVVDTDDKGAYAAAPPSIVREPDHVALLLEGTLHADPNGKSPHAGLVNHPGLFPFQLSSLTGDAIAAADERLHVSRFGLDEIVLGLRT